MRGSHTPLLPLQALSQPSNMGSRTIGACSQVFRFTFFQYTTITVAHSAYFSNVPLFPRPYTTTYLLVSDLSRRSCRFGNYRSRLLSFLCPYFTALFHAVYFLDTRNWSLSMPFRGGHSRYGYPGDTIHHVTLFLPTYRDCTPHVPWRLWKVKDSNLRCLALRFIIN